MISIEQWPGLATNAAPYSLKPGAAVTQVNLQVIAPGELVVRQGVNGLSFASHQAGTSRVWRVFRYPAFVESIIYQSDDGAIRLAAGPS